MPQNTHDSSTKDSMQNIESLHLRFTQALHSLSNKALDSKPKIIAILGSSGSGKTALAHEIALQKGCEIFSLDSLGIYKGFDIASAKPTPLERTQVCYYALDVLSPSEKSNAMLFFTLLCECVLHLKPDTPLLIVGGSSFFLKSIVEGLSPMPNLQGYEGWLESLGELKEQYAFLHSIDTHYANKIAPQDTYRIHKALSLYKATQLKPSEYFATHKPLPFPLPLEIFALDKPRDELRADILKRSQKMIEQGIVEETKEILESYGEGIPPLNAIGPKECVAFLQGRITSLESLQQELFFHTCQLAKRQATFNRTQFPKISLLSKHDLQNEIYKLLAI
nr:tRNA (adenosine(37)-N6)-dimethylallyltransferase MiaA [uncultured Helicobacter sp.]